MTDSESRQAGEAAIHRSGEQKHDVTQTFGHDSDLSFVPFGVELTDSPYVVISMRIMTRMGAPVLAAMGEDAPLLVAMTGYGQHEVNRHARKAEFDHHLVKPADMSTLRELLAQGK